MKRARIKRAMTLVLVCIMSLGISGCGNTNRELSCTLNVVATYSGYGEDGRDLGSGTFTDTFPVSAGDEFYEWFNGHWNKENQRYNNAEIIISIKEINDHGVTINIDDEEIVMPYNTSKDIKSRYVVFDGQNYEYSFSFAEDCP